MRIEMFTRGIWDEGRNAVDQEAIDDAIIGRRHERPGIRRRSSAPGRLTSATGKGASIFKMMGVSRHKSVDTLRGHVRDASYSRIMPGLARPERGCAPHICSGGFCEPGLYTGILLGPDLCPRILHVPDPLVLLRGLGRCWSILHNLCWGILYGLYRLDLCRCIFLGRPSLELLQQGSRWILADFCLALTGGFGSSSNFVAGRRAPCSRRQGLSVSGRLNCLSVSG